MLSDPRVAEAVGVPPDSLFALQPSQSYSLSIAYAQVPFLCTHVQHICDQPWLGVPA